MFPQNVLALQKRHAVQISSIGLFSSLLIVCENIVQQVKGRGGLEQIVELLFLLDEVLPQAFEPLSHCTRQQSPEKLIEKALKIRKYTMLHLVSIIVEWLVKPLHHPTLRTMMTARRRAVSPPASSRSSSHFLDQRR